MFAPKDCAILEIVLPLTGGWFGPLAFANCLGQPVTRHIGRVADDTEVHAAGLQNVVYNDYWVDCPAIECKIACNFDPLRGDFRVQF